MLMGKLLVGELRHDQLLIDESHHPRQLKEIDLKICKNFLAAHYLTTRGRIHPPRVKVHFYLLLCSKQQSE
jgi:hypothetical protein